MRVPVLLAIVCVCFGCASALTGSRSSIFQDSLGDLHIDSSRNRTVFVAGVAVATRMQELLAIVDDQRAQIANLTDTNRELAGEIVRINNQQTKDKAEQAARITELAEQVDNLMLTLSGTPAAVADLTTRMTSAEQDLDILMAPQFRVSGAGSSYVNGDYRIQGQTDGYAAYAKVNADGSLFYHQGSPLFLHWHYGNPYGQWAFGPESSGRGSSYYWNNNNSRIPPSSGYSVNTAAAPAPTVTRI